MNKVLQNLFLSNIMILLNTQSHSLSKAVLILTNQSSGKYVANSSNITPQSLSMSLSLYRGEHSLTEWPIHAHLSGWSAWFAVRNDP